MSGKKPSLSTQTFIYQFPIIRGYPFRKNRVRWGWWGGRMVGGLPLSYVHIFPKPFHAIPFRYVHFY